MPNCTTCDSGLRATVEALATEGLTPTKIAARLGDDSPSISSIRRHLESHWQRAGIAIEPASRELDAAEAVSGLYALWDSAEAVRINAEERGDATTALRAGEQGVRVMTALGRTFGIDSRTVAESLTFARGLALSVGLYGREHPEFYRALAEVARRHNYPEVEANLIHLATAREAKKENHDHAAA